MSTISNTATKNTVTLFDINRASIGVGEVNFSQVERPVIPVLLLTHSSSNCSISMATESPDVNAAAKFTFDIDDLQRDSDRLVRKARKRLGSHSLQLEDSFYPYNSSEEGHRCSPANNNISSSSAPLTPGLQTRSTSSTFRGTASISTRSTGSSGGSSYSSKSNQGTPKKAKSFLSKFVNWQRGKKPDKIRLLLDSLFPKLRTSEEEVNDWLDALCDQRESVWCCGERMLHEIEDQVYIYQKHLNLLEDTMNDIRQLDYDILKEIEELRVAFAFNQELLHRENSRASASKLVEPSARLSLSLSSKGSEASLEDFLAEATGMHASSATVQDMLRVGPPSGVASIVFATGRPAAATVAVAVGYPKPAPGSPTALAKSLFASAPVQSSPSSTAARARATSTAVAATSSSSCDSRAAPKTAEKRICATSRDSEGDCTIQIWKCSSRSSSTTQANQKTELLWDGSDYKRKCLMNSNISVQQLMLLQQQQQLDETTADVNFIHSGIASKDDDSARKKESSSNLLSGHFMKSLLPKKLMTPEKAAAVKTIDRKSSPPPPPMQASLFKSVGSPRVSESRSRCSTTCTQPHSSIIGHNGSNEHKFHSVDSSHQQQQHQLQQAAKRQRASTSCGKKSNRSSSDRLSYMLETLCTEEVTAEDLTDPDQREMVKRMNNCLSLKDTLKSLLFTIESTQEDETTHLRQVKKLRNELKCVMDGAPRWTQLKHSNSLPTTHHHPPLHHQHPHHPQQQQLIQIQQLQHQQQLLQQQHALLIHHPNSLHHSKQADVSWDESDYSHDLSGSNTSQNPLKSHASKAGYYIHTNEGSICSSLNSFDHPDSCSHSPAHTQSGSISPVPTESKTPVAVIASAVEVDEQEKTLKPAEVVASDASCCCDAITDIVTCTSDSQCACSEPASCCAAVAITAAATASDIPTMDDDFHSPVSSPSNSCHTARTSIESISRSSSGCSGGNTAHSSHYSVSALAKLGIAELQHEDTDSECIDTEDLVGEQSALVSTAAADGEATTAQQKEAKKQATASRCIETAVSTATSASVVASVKETTATPPTRAEENRSHLTQLTLITSVYCVISPEEAAKHCYTANVKLESAVGEVVGDLKALLSEEKLARTNLDRIHGLLENAHQIHMQLDNASGAVEH